MYDTAVDTDWKLSSRMSNRHFCIETVGRLGMSARTYTKHGPGSMDHRMDPVHGPPWTTPWTWSMDQVPWTTPNFQKEIALVNFIWKFTEGQGMKNRLLFIAYILEGLSRKSVLFWDRGVLRYRRSSAFLPPIFSFQHFQIAIQLGRHPSLRQPPAY